ncbi:MAG TPA: Hpt domain-containing protein [Flavobacteriales bacterium]|nr:Hpt domain-containing protein [Flavobacteriales bacterium]HMU14306.1 Hpt domain-containing protein [Flavobacteriales bacterium]
MNTPSIDLSYLERLYKGDRARVHAWVNIYLEELPILLARMDTCIRQDDAAGLVQVLHDIRPQAHYLGAREMHDILERMGSEARSRGASACTSCALELRATCQAVERSLRTSFRSA